MDPSPHDMVCLARVGAAHGVRGEVRIRCFTEQPEDVTAYGPLYDRSGKRILSLSLVRSAKDMVVARVAGVRDRDAAEALRGLELYVPRSALPAPDQDEFYVADLIGLEARLADGRPFGVVRNCGNFGAGDVLDVETGEGRIVSLPFTARTVPEVDLKQRRIVVDPPAGLPGAGS
jgi:16S rRNA processing protein RimM